MGFDKDPIKVRLIRVELSNGETEILITSLTDMDKHPINIFADLYHKRWPVEEDYKTMKYRMQLENFSGKSTLSVYQDFYAKVFSKDFQIQKPACCPDKCLSQIQVVEFSPGQ